MTISNQDARTGPYSGNGATTSFAYDFKVIDEDHLVVTLKDSSDVETVQTITTHYTVTGVGADGGGTVEMVVAPASGETLTISRAVPLTQEVDLANRGGVQPEVLETAYDKLTQSVQDQAELFARIPRFPVSSSLTNVELPLTLTAGASLQVNTTADGFENGPATNEISNAQTYATNAATSATESANSATASANSATASAASAVTAATYAGTQTVDRFNGTGSQTDFTLSQSPATENNTSVYISGIYQQKDTYSISGTTLTFSVAPPTGTGTIEVMHMSTLPTGVSPTIGTTTTGAAGTNASVSVSGHELSFTIPRGDTGAQGIQGIQGIQGNVGTAATIAVGSTTTGAAGSSAAVTNSGSSSAATFDFTVPRGDTGATGPQGPQGIQGDTGPAGSLSGASDGTSGAPSISFSADTDTGMFRPGADQLGFATAGSTRMQIDSSGDAGIGATPSYRLDVYKSASTVARIRNSAATGGTPSTTHGEFVIESTDANMGMQFLGSTTANQRILFGDTDSGGSGQIIYDHTSNYMALSANGTERLRIDSSGNVGIGRSSPTRHLSVNGSIQFASGGVIEAGTSALNTYIAGVEGASGRWAFATNGSERMRIDSSGNVGIGVTPSYKLHVAGDIYATGNVTAYSSAVAKDDITTIPNALDLVEQLRGVSFKWKEGGKKAVGLIYEEVKEVIPELTSDEGGHVGVAYQNSVALLIEAVKTLSAKVKELECK